MQKTTRAHSTTLPRARNATRASSRTTTQPLPRKPGFGNSSNADAKAPAPAAKPGRAGNTTNDAIAQGDNATAAAADADAGGQDDDDGDQGMVVGVVVALILLSLVICAVVAFVHYRDNGTGGSGEIVLVSMKTSGHYDPETNFKPSPATADGFMTSANERNRQLTRSPSTRSAAEHDVVSNVRRRRAHAAEHTHLPVHVRVHTRCHTTCWSPSSMPTHAHFVCRSDTERMLSLRGGGKTSVVNPL